MSIQPWPAPWLGLRGRGTGTPDRHEVAGRRRSRGRRERGRTNPARGHSRRRGSIPVEVHGAERGAWVGRVH
jgi:hypothetical protein